MIIFGRWKQFKKLFWPVEKLHCDNCNNDDYFLLERISTWFTLFFIPIFPYEVVYFFYCPVCQHWFKITAQQAKGLIPLAETNNDFLQWKIDEETYHQLIAQIWDSWEHKEVQTLENKDTKKCPHCDGDVLEVAKKCKHCHQWI